MVRNEHLLRYFKYNLPWSLAFQLITSIEAFSQGVWWRHPTTHRSPRTSTFLKIKLSNRCFSGNSLLLHCQRYLNIFCPARSSISSRGFLQCFFSSKNITHKAFALSTNILHIIPSTCPKSRITILRRALQWPLHYFQMKILFMSVSSMFRLTGSFVLIS